MESGNSDVLDSGYKILTVHLEINVESLRFQSYPFPRRIFRSFSVNIPGSFTVSGLHHH